jgi:hypothetical protein
MSALEFGSEMAATADNHLVEECHEKARATGFNMKVFLQEVIGFANLFRKEWADKVAVAVERSTLVSEAAAMNPNGRRFLHSLRIAAGVSNQQAE